jgi:hypothetical protein
VLCTAGESSVWLDIPFVKQQKNGCGAASIAMVMGYWQGQPGPSLQVPNPEQILHDLRKKNLPAAGIPDSVPIRVTENGWPTGKNPFTGIERSYTRQAEVMETIIVTIYDLRTKYNISHYEFFGLRDADSLKEDLFHQFGILRDDYSPKPAYDLFKRLIEEFGM